MLSFIKRNKEIIGAVGATCPFVEGLQAEIRELSFLSYRLAWGCADREHKRQFILQPKGCEQNARSFFTRSRGSSIIAARPMCNDGECH